jgi:hypothetical protein
MSVCLVAIFKNESHILFEFVTHYMKQGVDRFYFIDNGSTDNWKNELQPFIDRVHVVTDSTRHAQSHLYNKHYLNQCKKHEWVIVADLDEFIYSRNGFSTIKEYLGTLDESISTVFVPWKMFGSNGYQEQPKQVTSTFTKRLNYDKPDGFQGVIFHEGVKCGLHKSIARSRDVVNLDIHSVHATKKSITSDHRTSENLPPAFSLIDEQILQNSCLHLNHYCIQSYDWFMKVKATRGCVNSDSTEHVRNDDYFRRYDEVCNDIDDFELRDLVYS